MSAPLKPWESNYNSRVLQSSSSVQNLSTPVGRMRISGPPVPPRPPSMGYDSGYTTTSYSPYNRSYGMSPYSSYGAFMGGYGGYGAPMGGYGAPMGAYGYNGPESSFIQLAEESTRPAFQSIESVVRAFSGISMMMDSTFFAITSSFRAVLGIAENFGRLRTMFSQIWSSFALFRLLNWIYRTVLTTLGIKKPSDFGKQAWSQAVEGGPAETAPRGASWPIFVFLGIIISAPYLISKMIPNIVDRKDPSRWPSPGTAVKVLYEFRAAGPQELSVSPGEIVKVAPRVVQEEMGSMNSGWVFCASRGGAGLVPRNYLQPPVKRNVPDDVPATETATEDANTTDIL